MSKKRLNNVEASAALATLAELRKRRGALRFVMLATDATDNGRGGYTSETLELLGSLPSELYAQGLAAIGDEGDIEVRPA